MNADTFATEQARNPYIGPVSFQAKDRDYFFGRDQEIAILQGLILASREMLFYAQSGAGKSSLLRAGVIPELTRSQQIGRGQRARVFQPMQVLPIVRVSGVAVNESAFPIRNIYVFHALSQLLPHRTAPEIAQWTLTQGLADYRGEPLSEEEAESPLGAFTLAESERANATLLIFDQFEEIFSTNTERWQDREQFFRQVAEALARFPFLHVLFTMREDYIAELTPYCPLLPDQLEHRFRMERMKRNAALLAVREPALRGGRAFAVGVAEALVEDLARIQVTQHQLSTAAGEDETKTGIVVGDYIEPVHLQIICHQLWDKLAPEVGEIQHSDVQKFGNVDEALTAFYEDALHKVIVQFDCSERQLRNWFDQQLITSARTRGMLYCDEETGTTAGLNNKVIDALRDVYLVRATLRGGDTWVELVHDRLINPILLSNQQWAATFANPLVAALRTWLQQGRQNAHLLKGTMLVQAQSFANQHNKNLTADEKEFLRLSLQHAAQQRTIRIGIAAGLLLFLTIGFWALFNQSKFVESMTHQQAIQQANAAQQALEQGSVERALTLAIQANRTQVTMQGLATLRAALDFPIHTVYLLQGHANAVNRIQWSPDGKRLASMSKDKSTRLWDMESGTALSEPLQQEGAVLDGRWSPNGQMLLTWSNSGELLLWNTLSNTLALKLGERDAMIRDASFSPNGERIASAEPDGTVRVWDLNSETPIREWRLYAGLVLNVIWSKDGTHLLSAGKVEDATTQIKLTNVESGDPSIIVADAGDINSLAWSQDESRILTSGVNSDTSTVWDGKTGAPLQVLAGGSQPAEWDNANRKLLTVDMMGLLHLYDLPSESELSSIPGFTYVSAVRLQNSGERLLASGYDSDARGFRVHVWNSANVTGPDFFNDSAPSQNINDLQWQPGGERFAVANADGSVRIYQSGAFHESLAIQHDGPVYVAEVVNDQQLLSAGGTAAYLTNLATGQIEQTFKHDKNILSAKLSPNHQLLLTASEDGSARVWNVASGEQVYPSLGIGSLRVPYAWWVGDNEHIRIGFENRDSQTYTMQFWSLGNPPIMQYELTGHTGPIKELWWKSDGSQMATASNDGTVRIWDSIDGRSIITLTHTEGFTETRTAPVLRALWIQNDRYLLSYATDGLARLWDAETWQPLHTFVHQSRITTFNYDVEGQLVSGEANGTVHIWDAATGEEIQSFVGHSADVTVIRWNRNRTALLTASVDGSIRIWNVRSGKARLIILGHADQVNNVLWNQAETKLLSASSDGTARIWDAQSGEELVRFASFTAAVLDAQWMEKETKVLVRAFDGQVRIYDVDANSLLNFACEHAVRNLTPPEWNRYIGSQSYEKTCPQLPLIEN